VAEDDLIAQPATVRAFGERVRRLRITAALSEDELARRCGLVTISKIETGRREPRLSQILMLCDGLGVPPDTLMRDLPEPQERRPQ
jgi:transcriptional regulator with XRE-family HTH domain